MTKAEVVGGRVRDVRQAMCLSVEEVAQLSGVSQTDWLALEGGQCELSLSTLSNAAMALHWDIHHFFEAKRVDELLLALFRKSGSMDRLDKAALCDIQARGELQWELGSHDNNLSSVPKLTGTPRNQGVQLAKFVREKISQPDGPLVNPFNLVRCFRIPLFRVPLVSRNLSGVTLFCGENQPVVVVNSKEDIFRQMFSVCHELCHALVDAQRAEPVASFSDDNKSDIEARANSFAAALLLPEISLRELWKNVGGDWPAWRAVLTDYKVNFDTFRIRLRELRLLSPEEADQMPSELIRATQKKDPDEVVQSELSSEGLNLELVQLALEGLHNDCFSWGWCAERLRISEERLLEFASHLNQPRILRPRANITLLSA